MSNKRSDYEAKLAKIDATVYSDDEAGEEFYVTYIGGHGKITTRLDATDYLSALAEAVALLEQ